jgi:cell division protein ZapA (FtsZ GTPase activity inhibitor)
MTGIQRWNDERLDDLATKVRDNTGRLDQYINLKTELVDLRGHVENAERIAVEALTAINLMKDKIEAREKSQRDERKADLRWMIGTLLVSAGLIVAAVRVFTG